MKKFLSLVCVVLMAAAVCACTGKNTENAGLSEQNNVASEEKEPGFEGAWTSDSAESAAIQIVSVGEDRFEVVVRVTDDANNFEQYEIIANATVTEGGTKQLTVESYTHGYVTVLDDGRSSVVDSKHTIDDMYFIYDNSSSAETDYITWFYVTDSEKALTFKRDLSHQDPFESLDELRA